jgi:hypothetical protein
LFVPNNSMVQRHITFTLHFHSLLIHSGEAGASVLLVPPTRAVFLFSFWRGPTPPQCPIHGLLFQRALIP